MSVWCNAWWSLFPSALLLLLFSDIYFWGKGINKLIKYDCWFILFNIYFSWIHCWFLRHIWCKYNILYVFMFYVFNERKEKIWKHNLYLAPPSTINHHHHHIHRLGFIQMRLFCCDVRSLMVLDLTVALMRPNTRKSASSYNPIYVGIADVL